MSDTKKRAAAVQPGAAGPAEAPAMPKSEYLRYIVGFFVFGAMWIMSGCVGSNVLFPQRFEEVWPGQGEVVLTTMNSVGIVFALISSVLCGGLSDRTRSRFGKRTPWIAVGGLICGVAFWLTASAGTVAGVAASWSLLQVGLNMMLTPATAIMSERIPFANRGTASAFYGAGCTVGTSVGVIIGSHFLTNPLPGYLFGAISYTLTGILMVFILPREESSLNSEVSEPLSLKVLFSVFQPPTKNCHDYYMAFAGRLFFYLGYWGIVNFQLYILQKYIGLSVEESGTVMSTMSLITMVLSLIVSIASGYISDKIGRRKPIVAVATLLVAVGIALPWLMRTAMSMYLYCVLYSIGYGIYASVDQALVIDVLPSKETAGKDLGFFNIATNVGQICSPILGSTIVTMTGSYFLVFPVAIVFLIAGAGVIMFIRKVN